MTLRNNQHMRERRVDADVSNVVGAEVAASLTDDEKRIVNYIAEHGRINATRATRRFVPGIRWQNADKRLKALAAKGVVKRVDRFTRDDKCHYVSDPQAAKPTD